jgi:molybdopterin molybdotransferase
MTISVEEARKLVLARCELMPVEEVELLDSLGRVLARDIVSDIDVAPFDNSAMDGFAVRAADLAAASETKPVELRIVDEIAAGAVPEAIVGAGEASRIMTGAPMPEGADAVVMVEYTREPEANVVEVMRAAPENENVRRRGEEVTAGDVVLEAGDVIGPPAIGLLAATGHATAPVRIRPRVAVISTGDELVEVAETPAPGKIRNSNSYSIAAQVIEAGGIPVRFGIVPDDEDATIEAFTRAAAETDFIVTSGGVSVGDYDFVKPVLEELGEMEFCRVAMRPGNPQTLGSIDGTPFFGLPGNPTSTFVGFEIFVRPALRLMQGHTELDRPSVDARLEHDVRTKPERRYYLRAMLEGAPDGGYTARLAGSQSSALLTAAHRGNCLLVFPEGASEFAQGSIVSAIRLDSEEGTP